MDPSTFGLHPDNDNGHPSNAQFAQLISQIREARNTSNISEHILTVLLSAQFVRFLDEVQTLTMLMVENNRLTADLLAGLQDHDNRDSGQFLLHLHQ